MSFCLAIKLVILDTKYKEPHFVNTVPCLLDKGSCIIKENPYLSQDILLSIVGSNNGPVAIMPMTNFKINLKWPGMNKENLALSLKGKDMYMGELRFDFQLQLSGDYIADLYIPICTTGSMVWSGIISQDNELEPQLQFELTTSQ